MPTGTYPDNEGVTLACTRIQEAAGYSYQQDGINGLDHLSILCPVIPIHCVFGGIVNVV